MLRKRVYPYEHMDSWKRINETLAENIEKKNSQQLKHGKYYIDADNKHAKTVWRDFELKNLQ